MWSQFVGTKLSYRAAAICSKNNVHSHWEFISTIQLKQQFIIVSSMQVRVCAYLTL